jgi:hypothetical protein
LASSVAALLGALLVVLLGDGPHVVARARLDLGMGVRVFRHAPFRYTAFGYFGHMWELYAFWALVGPFATAAFRDANAPAYASAATWVSFCTVAAGAVGCVAGGHASRRAGERRVATAALVVSGCLCLASPWLYRLPPPALCGALIVWGVAVVADSPQFSALSARHSPAAYTGTALTVQNGVGFAVSIATLALVPRVAEWVGYRFALSILAIGPVLGVLALRRLAALERE